jgi:hypothetical protein
MILKMYGWREERRKIVETTPLWIKEHEGERARLWIRNPPFP